MKKLEKFTCKAEWSSHHEELKNIVEMKDCFMATDGYRIGIIKKESVNEEIQENELLKSMLIQTNRYKNDNNIRITINRKSLITSLNEQYKEFKTKHGNIRRCSVNTIIYIDQENNTITTELHDKERYSGNRDNMIAFNLQYLMDVLDFYAPDREKELTLRFANSSIFPVVIDTDKRTSMLLPIRLS